MDLHNLGYVFCMLFYLFYVQQAESLSIEADMLFNEAIIFVSFWLIFMQKTVISDAYCIHFYIIGRVLVPQYLQRTSITHARKNTESTNRN
jgi:hypothetical protein